MKRVFKVIQDMYKSVQSENKIQYSHWKTKYAEASKNRLEPEYPVSADNSFSLIMDKSRSGKDAYMGILDDECARE